MRIMYLTESMGWSGGAQQLLWMARAVQRLGHELFLTCQPGSDIADRAEASGLTVDYVRMRQDYDVPSAYTVSKLLKKHRIDVLHAQHSTAHAIGLMAATWAKSPVFAVTRRVTFAIKHNVFSRIKYLSRRINGYVAISEAVRDELLKAGIEPSRIQMIPSVIDFTPASSAEARELRDELQLKLEIPVITTVANYSDFKGHETLVHAAVEVIQAHPHVQFLIVGRDTEKLQPLVDRLGIKASVRLAGFRKDIARVLAASNFFVLPSLQEAAGTALREAMAAGLPCVATNVGGIPESIASGVRGLLVPASDPLAMASAIDRLLSFPEEAAQLAKAGQTFVNTHFSLKIAAQTMESFYERLLKATA